MGKRFSDGKHINYLKRKKKQKNRQENFERREEEKKAVAKLLKYETGLALSTIPEPGTSREPLNDQNTPKSYFHHVIRKTVRDEVDKVFCPKKDDKESKEEKNEHSEANITPTASYDFFE